MIFDSMNAIGKVVVGVGFFTCIIINLLVCGKLMLQYLFCLL